MGKKINYYVIGGQYESHCYGGTETLEEAKKLAKDCEEYWDNFEGLHTPNIYKAEDTEEIEAHGWLTVPDGWPVRVPTANALPVGFKFSL